MTGDSMHVTINRHEEIVKECKGCQRIKEWRGKLICMYTVCPKIEWWFGFRCPQATHVDHKEIEDPFKDL